MKKFVLLLIAMLMSISALSAQSIYRVVCQSQLNIRTAMSSDSEVAGVLQNGDLIEVKSISGDWACLNFNGSECYVAAKYLQYVREAEESTSASSISMPSFNFSMDPGNTKWCLFIILPLIFFLYKFSLHIDYGKQLTIFAGLILVFCGFEFLYMIGTQEPLWFLDDPEWYFIALNFIAFCFFSFAHAMTYFAFLSMTSLGSYFTSLIAWPAAIVVGIIFEIVGWNVMYVLAALGLAQLIQAGIILYRFSREYNFFTGLLYALVFLIFTFLTMLVILRLMSILIAIAIIFIIVSFALCLLPYILRSI